LFDIGQ